MYILLVRFVGRGEELGVLTRAFQSERSAFIPIYGRRRVGKSELIHQFMKRRPGIYFLGKTATPELQLREFLEQSARVLDEPLIAEMPAHDWKKVLLLTADRWSRSDQKLIICLDEFQWIVEASPELPSVLQECWDLHWSRSANVMLILCGSFIGFMERDVLGQKSPLFGRRTGQILLRPLSYRVTREFHPNWSLHEQAKAYFICGGIPLYLQSFDSRASVEKNIEEAILSQYSPLFREPDFLLREELRDVDSYFAVLTALATGAQLPNAIAKSAGISQSSVAYYLNQLQEIGYIRRLYPLTGQKPVAKHVRYSLHDPFLRFWFRFVFPRLSFLEHSGSNKTLREYIRPELPSYFGKCFESLCRQALPRIYERDGVSTPYEIGEYWSKGAQIDVVGYREDNWTDLGGCKWGAHGGMGRLRQDMERRVSSYPNHRGATIGRRFFLSKSVEVDPQPGEYWYSLENLYE